MQCAFAVRICNAHLQCAFAVRLCSAPLPFAFAPRTSPAHLPRAFALASEFPFVRAPACRARPRNGNENVGYSTPRNAMRHSPVPKRDAMLLYRAALDARPASEKPDGDDELAANFARLRNELGGTANTEKLLAKAPRPAEENTEGRWEIPTKDMPAWELPDLAGRRWTAKSLHGKTVLINVWATWCGPCRTEHPALEALYEKIKNRTDIQLVTFNIDEAVGDVAPYMSKNKYTFPVLVAKDYVNDLLPSISIPMLWIVDAAGKWRWQQNGYDDDPKWETTILEKLDHTKPQ